MGWRGWNYQKQYRSTVPPTNISQNPVAVEHVGWRGIEAGGSEGTRGSTLRGGVCQKLGGLDLDASFSSLLSVLAGGGGGELQGALWAINEETPRVANGPDYF